MQRRKDCRLCSSKDLQIIISLGDTPLANAFVAREDVGKPQKLYPLDLDICAACGHVQLLDIVDPEVLFRNYLYVSSTSPVFVDHFRRYAEAMIEMLQMPKNSVVIEFGSNDGTLLRFFKEAGMQVLGVDPARALAAEATINGIETLPEFFNLSFAKKLKERFENVTLIAANNVFAHTDDLHSVTEGVEILLGHDGVFVFEVSYLLEVYEKNLFDMFYHEHLSYHTVKPLIGLFEKHGMELIDVIEVDSHGGSMRGIAQRKGGKYPKQPSVERLVARERLLGLHKAVAFEKLFQDVRCLKASLIELLNNLKQEDKKIIGYGAPAKATTLIYYFGLDYKILDYIIDDSPLKQGLYSPGCHIPVKPSNLLYDQTQKPDYALIFAWNFAVDIIKKHTSFVQEGGHFIIPLPSLQVT
jgi:SAM-dependent methyltransferase